MRRAWGGGAEAGAEEPAGLRRRGVLRVDDGGAAHEAGAGGGGRCAAETGEHGIERVWAGVQRSTGAGQRRTAGVGWGAAHEAGAGGGRRCAAETGKHGIDVHPLSDYNVRVGCVQRVWAGG